MTSPVDNDEEHWRAEDDPAAIASHWRCVVPRRIAELADLHPDRPFISDVDGRSLSYAEFEVEIRRWCTLLERLGVRAGDRVASMLPSSIDAHLLWFAASRVGALEVPVNRELRGEFLRHVMTDSGAQLCFCRPEDADTPSTSGVDGLRTIVVERTGELVADLPPAPRHDGGDPADVACVIYTSGTTGPAKGVMVTWAQLSTSVGRLPRSWLGSHDAYYSPWPIFHVSGRTAVVTMTDAGGRVVCRERPSVTSFWEDVRVHNCTFSVVSPIALLLLATPPSSADRDHPLKWVYVGAPAALDFQRRFGVRALTSYGSTEMGFVAVKRWLHESTTGHIGWPRPGYEIRLVDEHGHDVADGEPGELWVKPPLPTLITTGYLGQPERTAAAIVDGWYRSGDLLRRDGDGSLRFVDRLGDTIRRFGENISAVAVEHAIEAEPDIVRCGVVGVPSRVAGAEVLVAVVPAPGYALDPEALFDRLTALLPRHALPAYLAVVEALPLTPNGKVRRKELRTLADNPALWRSPVAIANDNVNDNEAAGVTR